MILLYSSVLVFNFMAYKLVKRLSGNMIVHIWVFTIAFQMIFDTFVDIKYKGYWYVSQGIDWIAFPGYTMLIPPVNLIFLNFFPVQSSILKQISYLLFWEIPFLFYETLTLLPEPWGYLRYGWWTLWHSAVINPVLLTILVAYYKFARRLENKLVVKQNS